MAIRTLQEVINELTACCTAPADTRTKDLALNLLAIIASNGGGGGGGTSAITDTGILVLCDDGQAEPTPFLRQIVRNDLGAITVVDTELDGTTSYTPLGNVTLCAAGSEALTDDSELLLLCDLALAGPVTFIRKISYATDGTPTVTDFELDGTTPYTVTGTVTRCSDSDTEVLVLCDDFNSVSTPFLRFITRAEDGSVTVTNTELDGETAYTVQGTVELCAGSAAVETPVVLGELCYRVAGEISQVITDICPDQTERTTPNYAVTCFGDPAEVGIEGDFSSNNSSGFFWTLDDVSIFEFEMIDMTSSGDARIDGFIFDGNAYGMEVFGQPNGTVFGPQVFSATVAGQVVTFEVVNNSSNGSFITTISGNAPGTQSFSITDSVNMPDMRFTWTNPVSNPGLIMSGISSAALQSIGGFSFSISEPGEILRLTSVRNLDGTVVYYDAQTGDVIEDPQFTECPCCTPSNERATTTVTSGVTADTVILADAISISIEIPTGVTADVQGSTLTGPYSINFPSLAFGGIDRRYDVISITNITGGSVDIIEVRL